MYKTKYSISMYYASLSELFMVWNVYVLLILIFFNLLNLIWHTDNNFCFYAEVNFWDFVRNDNSNKGTTLDWMRLDSALKKIVPNISRPKASRHFLMHCVQLPDNFYMREHSWPCRFHISLNQINLSNLILNEYFWCWNEIIFVIVIFINVSKSLKRFW
jgi:hypothetical protein